MKAVTRRISKEIIIFAGVFFSATVASYFFSKPVIKVNVDHIVNERIKDMLCLTFYQNDKKGIEVYRNISRQITSDNEQALHHLGIIIEILEGEVSRRNYCEGR